MYNVHCTYNTSNTNSYSQLIPNSYYFLYSNYKHRNYNYKLYTIEIHFIL